MVSLSGPVALEGRDSLIALATCAVEREGLSKRLRFFDFRVVILSSLLDLC